MSAGARPTLEASAPGGLAVVLARQAAPRDTIAVAATISVAGLVGLVAAARLTVGLRPPSR